MSSKLLPALGAAILVVTAFGPRATSAVLTPGFAENAGQVDPAVLFYGSTLSGFVYFTSHSIVFDLREHTSSPLRGCVVRLRFDRPNGRTEVEPRQLLPHRVHYFRSSDPRTWRTHVRSFAEIRYSDVWPGIDLVFRAAGRGIEYDAVTQPGADVSLVQFTYEGVDRVVRDDATDRLETELGVLVHRAPGAGLLGEISLQGERSAAAPPLLDDASTMGWCTYLGGFEEDGARAVALDSSDRPVTAGETLSNDFPVTAGAYDSLSNGNYDVFVAKLSADADTLLWCTYLGGSATERPFEVALDGAGHPLVVGTTKSDDFPVTAGAYDSTQSGATGDDDLFLTKLSENGDSLVWSTYLGGRDDEFPTGVRFDDAENVILVGTTSSNNFPRTPGAYDTDRDPDSQSGFVTKLAEDGGSLVWSTFLEGTGTDWIYELALDPLDNVLVVGSTGAADFPTRPGAWDETHNGAADLFVSKLDATGSILLFSTFVGSPGSEQGRGVQYDESTGDVIVVGATDDPAFPVTSNTYDSTYAGGGDIVVFRMDGALSTLVWSTYLGGNDEDYVYRFGLDGQGCPVLPGATRSLDFPVTSNAYDATHNGAQDIIVARLNPFGDSLIYSTFCGTSSNWEHPGFNGVAMTSGGDVILACATESPDFPTTPGVYDETHNGGWDAVLMRFQPPVVTRLPADVPAQRLGLRISPNPFRFATTIRYRHAGSEAARVSIHDLAGRLVRSLEVVPEGSDRVHWLTWDGRSDGGYPVAAGSYFCRIQIGDTLESKRVTLVR